MNPVQSAREYPIDKLIVSLGIKFNGNNKIKCPFHSDNKTASMHIYKKTNSYYCYGCNSYGDIISFVMQYYKTSFVDAVKMLTNESFIRQAKQTTISPKVNNIEPATSIQLTEIYTDFINMLELTNKGFEYINKIRKIPKNIIDKYNIKSIDNTENIIAKLKNKYSLSTLISSGIFSISCKTGRPYFTFFIPSIIIPHKTEYNSNKYNYCHSRSYEGKTFFKPYYTAKSRTFKGNLMIRDLIVVESSICAMSYEALTGRDNFIAITSLNRNIIKKILRIYESRITLMLDNDEITPDIYKELTKENIKFKNINPQTFAKNFNINSYVKDINDILLLKEQS